MQSNVKTELIDCEFFVVFEMKRRRDWASPTLRMIGTRSKKPKNLGSKQFAVKFKVAAPKTLMDDLIPEATIEVNNDKAITRNRLVAEALMADDA